MIAFKIKEGKIIKNLSPLTAIVLLALCYHQIVSSANDLDLLMSCWLG